MKRFLFQDGPRSRRPQDGKSAALVISALFLIIGCLFTACPTPADPASRPQTATPTTTAASQAGTVFTLSNTPAYAAGTTWKVYTGATGGTPVTDVSASYAGSTLTLESSGGTVQPGDYYVSATEPGKTESKRLKLTVTDPAQEATATPTTSSASVAKDEETQASVVFTLTNDPVYEADAVWKVYAAATGSEEAAGISASYDSDTNKLTLAHATNIPVATYYVSATETGKSESERLSLTVADVGAELDTAAPTTGTATITKTATTQASVVFTLTNDPAYAEGTTWKVYTAATGGGTAAGINANYDSDTKKLTLTHDTNIPAGTYHVSAAETGKNESERLQLTIEDYDPVKVTSITQQGGTSALTDTASIKFVLNKALENTFVVGDITLSSDTSGAAALGALTQDSTDNSGKTYTLALTSVTKEGDIKLTFGQSEFDATAGTGGAPAENVKTVRVFKNVNHTETHATASVPGLYAGAMGVPVSGLGNSNTHLDLLNKAFAWVKTNAVANGKYRVVLGADAASPTVAGSAGVLSNAGAISTANPSGTTITNPVWKEAWNLDATAFHATGVTITLAGDTAERTIQLTGTGQLFKIAGGTLRLDNYITLNGVAPNTGGVLVLVADTGKLIMETGSKITGNTVPNTVGGEYVGGGVLLYETAEFTMNGGEISGHRNEVTWGYNGNGGGLNMRYGTNADKRPTFTMNGGTIKNNFAKYGGGVMVVAGTFTMKDGSSIQGNQVSSWGGGVGLGADGSAGGLRTFNMEGGSITGNKSTTHGGGVYINSNGNLSGANSGYLNMTGGTISGNLAAGNGGGVWINTNGKIAKTGGVIHGSNAGTDDLKNRTVESLTNLTDTTGKGAAVWVATTTAVGLENTVDTDHNLTKAPTDSASVPGGSGWSD